MTKKQLIELWNSLDDDTEIEIPYAYHKVRTGLEWVNTIDDACDKRYSEEYAHGEYCHEQSFKWGFQEGVDWLEKQGSQILANPAKTCKVEHKPAAWSEEDEKKRTLLISILKVNHPNGYFKVNSANTLNMEAMHTEELINWLKSLKERYTWKPSDEQMAALNIINVTGNISYVGQEQELIKLYNDLENLRK